MKKISFSILIALSFSAFSQSAKIHETWNALLIVDDNEKNFRFNSFLELLLEEGFAADETPFSDWIYEDLPDEKYRFSMGILPFFNQNSVLIWLLSSMETTENYVFTKKLDFLELPETKPVVVVEANSLSISIKGKTYVDVPDLNLKLLFSQLKPDLSDTEKEKLSRTIWVRLKKLLEDKALFHNDFSDYEQLSTITSSDKKVKICTWNIEYNSGEQFFFGGMALDISPEPRVYEFTDERKSIKNPLQTVLSPDKWYGCIYYDILTNKFKGDTYYTLIGFNGNDAFTQIKLIDILTFSESRNPQPKFGASIFSNEFKNHRRLIFEYGKNTTMMLRYDPDVNMIVMDNLSPSSPFYQNDYRFYGPDSSHNGLRFDKGKWIYEDEIDLRNKHQPSNTIIRRSRVSREYY